MPAVEHSPLSMLKAASHEAFQAPAGLPLVATSCMPLVFSQLGGPGVVRGNRQCGQEVKYQTSRNLGLEDSSLYS